MMITGCDHSSRDYYPDPNEKTNTVTEPAPFKYLPYHKTIPYEDLSDPAFYKDDRLQFMWTPEGEKMEALWSMKLDGSDVRKVIDSDKLFFGGTWTFLHPPVRSPNRRYLAYLNLADEVWSGKVIYDLKTGERIQLIEGGTAPYFNWSPDSRYLFFYNDFKFYRYEIEKRQLVETKEFIESHGIYTLDDNKTILAVNREGISYHDYDGQLIDKKEFYLTISQRDFHAATRTGDYLVYEVGDKGNLFSPTSYTR